MKAEQSERYEIPGASGSGTTILVHKRLCSMPTWSQPRPYPHERRY
ncbi:MULTISPECIES: hypothetical protein [unclassified Streptomyces]